MSLSVKGVTILLNIVTQKPSHYLHLFVLVIMPPMGKLRWLCNSQGVPCTHACNTFPYLQHLL